MVALGGGGVSYERGTPVLLELLNGCAMQNANARGKLAWTRFSTKSTTFLFGAVKHPNFLVKTFQEAKSTARPQLEALSGVGFRHQAGSDVLRWASLILRRALSSRGGPVLRLRARKTCWAGSASRWGCIHGGRVGIHKAPPLTRRTHTLLYEIQTQFLMA